MLVRDIMHSPALAIEVGESLASAYAMMRERGIRHLPVVDEGRVVGVVTDRDLRLATSSLAPNPFPPGTRVGEVMNQPVLSADPRDPVEEAARTMRGRKIGCLPVLEGEKLVGIVTGLDLLDALVKLTGVHHAASRLEVQLVDRPGELARLLAVFAGRNLNVHSVLTYPDGEQVHAVLRVGTNQVRPLATELRALGFDVVWPPEKPW